MTDTLLFLSSRHSDRRWADFLFTCFQKIITGQSFWLVQADQVNMELTFAVCFNLGYQYQCGGLQSEALNTYTQILKNTQVLNLSYMVWVISWEG